MVFDSLRDRLSSLWESETPERDGTDTQSATNGGTAATDQAAVDTAAERNDESVSYAEQVEYGVDETELSDEDRILRLLVKRGGRVDETTILEETGWTETRLASVVDEMEADDQISAITVGRKHVICRRGFEPKGYRSHLHE